MKLLISLLIICGGLFLLFMLWMNVTTKPVTPQPTAKVETNTPTPAPQAQQQAQVTIANKGVVPEIISVKKGTQVTWTNMDKNPHWVASDPHPTHAGLPGFDSFQALTTNDAFSYTFDKTGTFTYHDHINPLKFRGTIIVE